MNIFDGNHGSDTVSFRLDKNMWATINLYWNGNHMLSVVNKTLEAHAH